MATQEVNTARLDELLARDRAGLLTVDEYVELCALQGKPEEQARREFQLLARLKELPEGYHRTMVM